MNSHHKITIVSKKQKRKRQNVHIREAGRYISSKYNTLISNYCRRLPSFYFKFLICDHCRKERPVESRKIVKHMKLSDETDETEILRSKSPVTDRSKHENSESKESSHREDNTSDT